MSIFGWLVLFALIWVFFRWCFLPTLRAVLRIVDPDEESIVQAELEEIAARIKRSDDRMAAAANAVRERLSLHRL